MADDSDYSPIDLVPTFGAPGPLRWCGSCDRLWTIDDFGDWPWSTRCDECYGREFGPLIKDDVDRVLATAKGSA
jgi:hypothetical protein